MKVIEHVYFAIFFYECNTAVSFYRTIFSVFLQYENNYVKKKKKKVRICLMKISILFTKFIYFKAISSIIFIALQIKLEFIKYAHVCVASECFSNQIFSFFISETSIQSFSRIRAFIRKELKFIKYFWIAFKFEIYRFYICTNYFYFKEKKSG